MLSEVAKRIQHSFSHPRTNEQLSQHPSISFNTRVKRADFNNALLNGNVKLVSSSSGPGCIKLLKIKWEFLQLFPVFRSIFSHGH